MRILDEKSKVKTLFYIINERKSFQQTDDDCDRVCIE